MSNLKLLDDAVDNLNDARKLSIQTISSYDTDTLREKIVRLKSESGKISQQATFTLRQVKGLNDDQIQLELEKAVETDSFTIFFLSSSSSERPEMIFMIVLIVGNHKRRKSKILISSIYAYSSWDP